MENLILKFVISIFTFYIGYFMAKYLDCWIEKRKSIKKANKRECQYCKKQHTMECPNSYICYSTITKPYFEESEDKQ